MNRSTAARSVPVLAALATLGIGVRAQAQCNAYTLTSATGVAIVPGTADSGNHADDVLTPLSFPFPVLFYGTSYTNAIFFIDNKLYQIMVTYPKANTDPVGSSGIHFFQQAFRLLRS